MSHHVSVPKPGGWLNLLHARRFWCLFIGPNLLFVLIAVLTPDPLLIVVLNLAKVAMAVMVCVAFSPGVVAMMTTDKPLDKESWLIFGIFLSWVGSAYQAGIALTWRFLGQPSWLVNSDLISYPLFIICIAAVIHVAVPSVIQGSVPTTRWIKIGAAVGGAVFVGLLALYWTDILRFVDRDGPMHDAAPGPASFQKL